MARDENLPFDLGQTYFNGDPQAIAAFVAGGMIQGKNLEGTEYWVEDNDYSVGTIGAQPSRSGYKRRVRIVRNMTPGAAPASTLFAKKMAKLKLDGTAPDQFLGQVNGLCVAAGDKGYPVDEYLGVSGCLQYDLCYVVVDGLAKVTGTGAANTGDIISPAAAGGVAVNAAITAPQLVAAVGLCALTVAAAGDMIVDVGGHRH